MTTSEIILNISAIQNGYPIEDLKYQGKEIWPLIRNQLCYYLTTYPREAQPIASVTKDIVANAPGRFGRIRRLLFLIMFGFKVLLHGSLMFLGFYFRSLLGVNTLVLALPEHFTVLSKGKMVNPITEGFIHTLQTLGIRWRYVQYTHEASRNRSFADNTRLFDSLLRMNNFLFSFFRVFPMRKQDRIEGFVSFVNYCKRQRGFDPSEIESEIIFQHNPLALTFKMLFRIYRPKNLVIYCYYDFVKMVALMAAASMKIRTIELQHGRMQGHWAYASWDLSRITANTYLPQTVLVWADSDKAFLASAQKEMHIQIEVLGNLWLNLNQSGTLEVDFNKLDFPMLYAKDKVKVLHSLQGVGIAPEILHVMKRSGQNISWFIRLHPRNVEEKESVSALLTLHQINYEIERSSQFPLYEILRNVDFHTTDCSVICREAEMFGVKNVLYTKLGYESFTESILAGDYFYALDPDEILSHLTSFKARPVLMNQNNDVDSRARKLLQDLLQ